MDELNGAQKNMPDSPTRKIIRAEEEEAWRDGFGFLREMSRIKAAESVKGFAEGEAAGRQEASKILIETTAKANRHLASLEADIAQLAFDIAKRILSHFDDAELVARVAHEALAEFKNANAVTVTVHPSARDKVQSMLASYLKQPEAADLEIVLNLDSSIDERSCILSTQFAVVEATIDAQLAAIRKAMISAGKHSET